MIRITALAFFVATSFSVFAAGEATTRPDLAKGKQIAETVCVCLLYTSSALREGNIDARRRTSEP